MTVALEDAPPPWVAAPVWGHSLSPEGGYDGTFETREEAVEEGIAAYGESFYVVRGAWFDPADFFDGDDLMEPAKERVSEECPEDAELRLKPDAKEALARLLTVWARRYVELSHWQAYSSPEHIEVPEGEP